MYDIAEFKHQLLKELGKYLKNEVFISIYVDTVVVDITFSEVLTWHYTIKMLPARVSPRTAAKTQAGVIVTAYKKFINSIFFVK